MSQFEPEFQQAASQIEKSIQPYLKQHPEIVESGILDRIKMPDRIIQFKVTWMDDNNKLRVNTGYRVQFNNAIGPYKGGIRFNKNVNLSIMKFLAYEQVFKNALTGLPMGGAKGGADFDPSDKSPGEIMRFTQAFMDELVKHIGPTLDVPAGDLGVGHQEIGYMMGHYKKLTGRSEGVFTGKPVVGGGSVNRTEATGYGLLYIMERALVDLDEKLEGKKVLVSGSGNVGLHAAEKAADLGAIVRGISNIHGTLIDEIGLDTELIKELRQEGSHNLEKYVETYPHAEFFPDNKHIYTETCDMFLFCATQNEAGLDEVKTLIEKGCRFIGEGANMPLSNEAQDYLLEKGILYIPGKAANAGGVSVSLFEMSQNATFLPWTASEVDKRLRQVMNHIYVTISETAKEYGAPNNFVLGANVAGFKKVVESMNLQGY